jgi:hypothetical protein
VAWLDEENEMGLKEGRGSRRERDGKGERGNMLQDERDDGEKLFVVAVFVSPVNLKFGWGGVSQRAGMQSAMVHLAERGTRTHARMHALDFVRLAAALPPFF